MHGFRGEHTHILSNPRKDRVEAHARSLYKEVNKDIKNFIPISIGDSSGLYCKAGNG
jgi:hypothetical protein